MCFIFKTKAIYSSNETKVQVKSKVGMSRSNQVIENRAQSRCFRLDRNQTLTPDQDLTFNTTNKRQKKAPQKQTPNTIQQVYPLNSTENESAHAAKEFEEERKNGR